MRGAEWKVRRSPVWLGLILRGTWISDSNVIIIHPVVAVTFHFRVTQTVQVTISECDTHRASFDSFQLGLRGHRAEPDHVGQDPKVEKSSFSGHVLKPEWLNRLITNDSQNYIYDSWRVPATSIPDLPPSSTHAVERVTVCFCLWICVSMREPMDYAQLRLKASEQISLKKTKKTFNGSFWPFKSHHHTQRAHKEVLSWLFSGMINVFTGWVCHTLHCH